MYRDLGDSPLHRRAGLGGGKGMGGTGLNMDQVLNRLQVGVQTTACDSACTA